MLPKVTTDMNNVQSLPDLVQNQSTYLKQTMDKAGNDLKTYINDVLTVEQDAINNNLRNQITSNDNNISSLNTRVSTVESTKANALDVYTKTELQPFLSGGDTLIHEEVYTIISQNNGDGTFTYNLDGLSIVGNLGQSGEQIFTLTKGTYPLSQNKVEALINDTLRRSVASGGLIEIDNKHIGLTQEVGNGAEVTIRYFERIGTIENTGIIQITNGEPKGYVNKIIIDTSV